MEFEGGSKEPEGEFSADMVREVMARVRKEHYAGRRTPHLVNLTSEELDRTAIGMPSAPGGWRAP